MADKDFFNDFKSEAKEFGNRVTGFIDGLVRGEANPKGFEVLADIFENNQAIVFELDLPGFEKSNVAVQVRDNELVIKGERFRSGEEEITYHLRERTFDGFERRFTLPEGIKEEAIKAKFENGVLSIALEKLAPDAQEDEEQGSSIEIE